MMKAGAKKRFAERFNLSKDRTQIEWLDDTGLMDLGRSDERFVKVSLYDRSECIMGLIVEIVSKTRGVLDRKEFLFSDHLSSDMEHRTDNRKEHSSIHGWRKDGEIEWYIATPKTVEPLMSAVLTYLLIALGRTL